MSVIIAIIALWNILFTILIIIIIILWVISIITIIYKVLTVYILFISIFLWSLLPFFIKVHIYLLFISSPLLVFYLPLFNRQRSSFDYFSITWSAFAIILCSYTCFLSLQFITILILLFRSWLFPKHSLLCIFVTLLHICSNNLIFYRSL